MFPISPDLAAQLDLLDDEFLTPDWEGSRNTLKPEASEVADLWLRRLARREVLGRVVLGCVADVFLARGAQHALGFARVSDYTRERLGLSASQFYEVARVARELRQLPEVSHALERGELGWTKVRELAGTATVETEAKWLAVAHAYTADGLKLAVRQFKSRPGSSEIASLDELAREAVGAALDRHATLASPDADELTAVLEDDEIEGEPTATFAMRCPRRVQRLWLRTRELARRVAGSQLPDWAAAEAVAAENLASPYVSGQAPGSAPDCGSGEEPGPRLGARRGLARSLKERHFIEATAPEPPIDREDDFDIIDSLRWAIDASLIDDRIPDELERLADKATEASPHELDRRMRVILAAMARVDWQLGRLLRMTFALRLHWELGYLGEGAYVRNRLGMCSRKARALVALDRRSWQVSLALTDAYRQGRLSWYRCLMLMPIVDEENTEAWLERACQVPVRRLKDELEWALEIANDSPLGLRVMPPPMGDKLDKRPCVHCGREHTDAELDPAAGTKRQIRGHESDACIACRYADEARAEVEVRIRGPVSVISMLYGVVAEHRKPGEPAWRGLERTLRHAEGQWSGLPKHRNPVYARDGWRCTAPVCSSRRNLEDHHVVFKSRRGSNVQTNRTAVCAWHHYRGIHAGRVRVQGTANGGLIWELGLRRGGRPLMTLRGDAYVSETEATAVSADA